MHTLLLLGHTHDSTLPALRQRLGQCRLLRVEALSDLDLVGAPDWRVQLTNNATDWCLTLADGRRFSAQTVQTVYSRLTYLQPAAFATATDTTYAQSEWHALVAGWLQNLGAAQRLGALFPTTLAAGTANPLLRVQQLAQAGLPVGDLWVTTPTTYLSAAPASPWKQEPLTNRFSSVLATRQTLTGGLAGHFRQGIRQLQALLECELLQVHFCQTLSGHWKATNYQTLIQPDSTAELNALATYLIQRTCRTPLAPAHLPPPRL